MHTANKIETFHPARGRGYEPSQRHFIFCLLITALLCLTAASNTASAETYYLDAVNGDDGNPGTSNAPWKTIARAFNIATYGDVVILRNGNYGEINNPISFPIYSGNMTEPLPENTQFITFKADEGHVPVFTRIRFKPTYYAYAPYIFDGIRVESNIAMGVDFYRIVGLRFKNCEIVGETSFEGYGFYLGINNNDIRVENCIIRNWMRGFLSYGSNMALVGNDIYSIGEDHIMMLSGYNILIENNKIHYTNRPNTGEHPDGIALNIITNIIIRNNTLYDLSTQGIFVHGFCCVKNMLIENNLLYNIGATELQLGSHSDGVIVRNNTVIGHEGYNVVNIGGANYEVYNNLFISNYWGSESYFNYHDHNIYIRGGTSPGDNEPHSYGYSNKDAALAALPELFVDPANRDYRLKIGSRAIDFGDPNRGPAKDILGVSRVFPPDAGCYEYISGTPDTTPPSTPQNLSATAISEHQIDLSWDASSDPESGVSYYKIYRDSNEIDTSVSTSYSNTGLNSGTPYSYEVSAVNGAGLESARSNTAQATTFSDTTPPAIVSVGASETSVEITFSEPLDTISAEQTSNYTINNGISVTLASLDTDTVTLTTSSHAEGSYILTVEAVRDIAGNPIVTASVGYEYTSGLVGYWRFDEGSGTTAQDSSGAGNTGTLINGPVWTTGKVGNALSFDGIDDYIDIGNLNVEGTGLTLAAWFKADSFIASGNRLISKATGSGEQDHYWMLSIISSSGDKLRFRLKTNGSTNTLIASSGNINTDEWVHAAAVYDGGSMILYKDGAEVGTLPKTGTISINSAVPAWIGRNPGGYAPFDGTIDEVHIYNRALTAGEILDLYNEGTTPDTTPPVISNVQSSDRFSSGATVTWITDENSTSQVEYGPSASYGSTTSLDTSLVSSHSVALTGLSSGTLYHYRVRSADASGNQSISQDNTFTTAVVTYSITASAGSGGTISPSGTTLVVSGGSQTYDITANTGYYIWDVLVDGSSVGAVSSHSFANVTANHTIAASFAIEITASAGSGGQISPSGATQVAVGGSQTYSITANTGYHISDVLVDSSSIGAISSYSFTNVTDNHTIAATFAIDTYTITASAGSGGTISPSGTTQVNSGSAQTYTITPNTGYHITDVLVDGSSVGAVTSYPFTDITADHTIAATFGEQDLTAPTVTNLSPQADSIQSQLNSLILLDVTDTGKGVDANTVEIKVNGDLIYDGDNETSAGVYDSTGKPQTVKGVCRRIGNKAAYKYIYQGNNKFDFDQTLTVTVNAKDLAATTNTMAEYSYSFMSEMRSFGENKILHSGSNNENWGPLTTVCDGSGNIWIAWPQGVVGSRDIYIGKLTVGTDSFVSSGVVQVTNDSNDQGNPVLAVDGVDKLYLAWQDNRQGEWDIYISTSDDWLTQTKITDPNSNQINPAIAVDSTDKVYVVWEDDQNSDKDIYIASSTNSFSTQVTTRITSAIYDQITPDIAVGYGDIADLFDDTVYVVWTDTRNTGGAPNPKNDIYGAASNSGSWTNIPIVTKEESQSNPAIATEAVGSVLHLVWLDDTNGDDDIYYATSDGLPASPLTDSNSIIDDTTDADQISPVIITTGYTGNGLEVFACWRDERNAEAELYAVETTANGTNIYVGNDFTTDDQSQPAIGIDQYDHPYLVWINGRTDICYAGSTFIEPTALASVTAPVSTTTTVGTAIASIADEGDASVVIPAGAYVCDMDVTISRIRNPQKPPSNNRTFLYEFGPSGTTFSKPVTITIPYNATTLVSSPSAYWYNPLTGLYSQEGITNVKVIQISSGLYALRFKTTHFSIFGGGGPFGGIFGGGGGGGCSMSPNSQDSIVELLLPYIGLAVAMVVLKLRDRRKRKAHNIAKSEC